MTKGYGKAGRGAGVLLLLLLLGGLAGSTLHDVLIHYLPLLGRAVAEAGFAPATLDLKFVRITFGLVVMVSPLTIAGLLLGYLIYRKL